MLNKKVVILLAGGKGERMGVTIPKQFLELQDKPILMWTIESFHQYDPAIQLIVVLPGVQIEFWKNLCFKHQFIIPHQLTEGGETRFHSVKNGLKLVDTDSLVAVHDGVRPLVSNDTISRCFEQAQKNLAVIPTMELVDSIRYVTEDSSKTCDRTLYRLVQTPQVFDGALLKEAYEQEYSSIFTDDASVVEALGEKIFLVAGNRENIKITTSFDMIVAEAFMNQQKKV